MHPCGIPCWSCNQEGTCFHFNRECKMQTFYILWNAREASRLVCHIVLGQLQTVAFCVFCTQPTWLLLAWNVAYKQFCFYISAVLCLRLMQNNAKIASTRPWLASTLREQQHVQVTSGFICARGAKTAPTWCAEDKTEKKTCICLLDYFAKPQRTGFGSLNQHVFSSTAAWACGNPLARKSIGKFHHFRTRCSKSLERPGQGKAEWGWPVSYTGVLTRISFVHLRQFPLLFPPPPWPHMFWMSPQQINSNSLKERCTVQKDRQQYHWPGREFVRAGLGSRWPFSIYSFLPQTQLDSNGEKARTVAQDSLAPCISITHNLDPRMLLIQWSMQRSLTFRFIWNSHRMR